MRPCGQDACTPRERVCASEERSGLRVGEQRSVAARGGRVDADVAFQHIALEGVRLACAIAARIVARIAERRELRWAMPRPRVDGGLRPVSLTRVRRGQVWTSSGRVIRFNLRHAGSFSCLILLTFGSAVPASSYALRYPIATLAKLGRAPCPCPGSPEPAIPVGYRRSSRGPALRS